MTDRKPRERAYIIESTGLNGLLDEPLDLAGVLHCLSVKANPDKQYFAVIVDKGLWVILVFDLGAFGLSIGTSVGWGSFVVTGSSCLSKAGPIGSLIGLGIGMLIMIAKSKDGFACSATKRYWEQSIN